MQLRGGTESVDEDFQLVLVYPKNAQSLQTEIRLDELCLELETLQWDVLILSGMWPEEKEEHFILGKGHHFFGAGGCKGEEGVAILLHVKWASGVKNILPVSERILAADVSIRDKTFRFVSLQLTCHMVDVQMRR